MTELELALYPFDSSIVYISLFFIFSILELSILVILSTPLKILHTFNKTSKKY